MSHEYQKLTLVKPDFDDPLTDMIIELDHERKRVLYGTTPPYLFFQLKDVFHLMESLGSARIEGNRTTLAQIADSGSEEGHPENGIDVRMREILNVEQAMRYIEDACGKNRAERPITHTFVRELHRLVTEGLPIDGEGDAMPGSYRSADVRIAKARHVPPPFSAVPGYMDELIAFLNEGHDSRYDLIKTALAHHRFVWVHPFANGNGRTVRLFTYALLIRQGFNVGGSSESNANKVAQSENSTQRRLLNPTAVFCADRDEYYRRLDDADSGDSEALLRWCRYVLGGLRTELQKIDRLLDFDYLRSAILKPAIKELRRKAVLGSHDEIILLKSLDIVPLQKQDVAQAVPSIGEIQLSRVISGLRDARFLLPTTVGGRKYVLGITRNPLFREVLKKLDENGFLPIKGEL